MEGNMIGADEINSIICLNKKRKMQIDVLEMPLSKHVCWGKKLGHDSSSDSSTDQNKVRTCVGARSEPIPENAKDSYSPDSVMSYLSSYPETGYGNSSETGLYSLESRSVTKANSSELESLSIYEELDRLHRDYGLHIYEDHLLEFENHADCSEYQTDKDLDKMLYSNGVAPSNIVLSSGRLPVSQDAQQGARKQTIDKEFEEYFSMLMM